MSVRTAPPDPDYILRSDRQPITAVQFWTLGDRNYIISGNQNGTVTIWDLKTRTVAHKWNAHNNEVVLSIRVLNNDFIATSGKSSFVHIWEVSEKCVRQQPVISIPNRSVGFCPVASVSVSKCHDLLFVPSEHQSSTIDIIKIHYNSKKVEKLHSLVAPNCSESSNPGMVMTIAFVDSDKLLVGYEDGSIKLWDTRNIKKPLFSEQIYKDAVMAIAYNSNINKGVAASVCDILKVFHLNNDGGSDVISVTVEKEIQITNPGVNCVVMRNDGKLFATGGWDSQGRLFSCKKCNPLAVLSFHQQSIQAIDFSSDNTLALGSRDGAISVWSVYK